MAGLVVSCMGMEESDPSSFKIPGIKTFEVKDNGSLVFELSASVDESLAGQIAECGFYYGKSRSRDDLERLECKMLGGSFFADLTLNDYDETFYVCAYISNGAESNIYEIRSDYVEVVIREFKEYVDLGTPCVTSYDELSEILSVQSIVSLKKGLSVTEGGLCYGPTDKLSIDGNHIKDNNLTDGAVDVSLDDIAPNASVYVCGYVCDGNEIAYGVPTKLYANPIPLVEIGDIKDITADGASVSASVSNDCGLQIRSRGVVYVEGNRQPSLSDGVQTCPGTVGDFTVILSGLKPNRLYSVRAFAENEQGVGYSSETKTITTKLDKVQVRTDAVTSVDRFSATLNATILNDGGEIIKRGFYLHKITQDGATSQIKYYCYQTGPTFFYTSYDLEQATRYRVKAFAENTLGESTGEEVFFYTPTTIEYALTLPNDTYVYMSGIVAGRTGRGFLLSDENGNMLYVYGGMTWDSYCLNVGDYVQVDGTMSQNYTNRELILSNVSVISKKSVPDMPALTLTTENIESFVDKVHLPCKIDVVGKLVKAGLDYNVCLTDDYICSPLLPLVNLDQYVGKEVVLSGYYLWTSRDSQAKVDVSFLLSDVVLVDELTDPSNCYIVSKSGNFSFKAVKGNSNSSVGLVKSVDVLWESFGTNVVPNRGDLIRAVSYADGSIIFRTADVFKEGNAVIAVRNASGEILWSWHIWFTDEPTGYVMDDLDVILMDRNLGSISASTGDFGALGLLYQWGRKDPFLGSASIADCVTARSTLVWPTPVKSSLEYGTIPYSIGNPTTLILCGMNADWYYTDPNETDKETTRWQISKTLYDPCPYGWRVPDAVTDDRFAETIIENMSFDSGNRGGVITSQSNTSTWFPASGCRREAGLNFVGDAGYYWIVSESGIDLFSVYNREALNITMYGTASPILPPVPSYLAVSPYAASVRCIKE